MPSDLPGPPEPLSRLAEVLARAASGVRPTPRELAELLWLAGHMGPVGGDVTAPPSPAEPPPGTTTDASGAPGAPAPPPARPSPDRCPRHEEPPPGPESPRAPLRLPPTPSAPGPAPDGATAEPHAALLAPAPPMLRHPLALQRALRPLQRRTDAPAGQEVDEAATADRLARLGTDPQGWLPVMRPVRERWLRLNLLYDTGPTMPVWRPLVRELHTALAQSGVFRTVTLHRAEPDGTVGGAGHAPADGRTVTLLISDCMGPQWRAGPAGTRWFATLRRWAHRMPLAVVQPLPEHLWRDTALPPVPGLLSAPHRAAPSAALAFTPYDTAGGPGGKGTVTVPVLEPGPEWLANWAALVASPGGTAYPGAAAALDRPLPADADDRTDVARLSAGELVLRFRATASPEAFRLAGHLALGRPDLPVMRLVQAAVEPHPRPQHLAEVILSGMLTSVAGPPGSYAFRPGVPELLLRGLPRTARARTHDLLLRTGGLIDERAGRSPGEFRALTPAPDGTETGARGEAFAAISPESARRLSGTEPAPVTAPAPGPGSGPAPHRTPFPAGLGGRYRLVQRLRPAGRVWLAEDTEAGRTVTIRLHEALTDRAGREAFLRDTRLLMGLDHRNVVAVLDAGVEDDIPYVVMEHLDGIALNVLARPYGHRLPAPLTVSVGAQLAGALAALHGAGVAHGALETSRVVLLPDGTAKLSLFAPGRSARPGGRSEDLRALCEVLLRLASGTSHLTVPIDSRQLTHLPEDLRVPYSHALDLLMSRSPSARTRGRDLLTDPELPRRAREEYARRSYRALGPLAVELPDGSPDFSPQERALLAMLLLKHGRTVTHEELRWGLWDPGDEPRDPRAELRGMATRLAAALGPGVLATPSHGYALHTSADYVDVVHCEELVRRADASAPTGAYDDARRHVTDALGLWRSGDPLADLPGPAARTARNRLLRLRLALHGRRAELDLALGDADRAAADLSGLLHAHPFREDFRRLYLIALRRQGRVEDALEVYEEYELSGGRNPELLALGRELREEHAEPPDDPDAPDDPRPYAGSAADSVVAAPDELPEGPFPTEDELWTPLLAEPEEEPREHRREEPVAAAVPGHDAHDDGHDDRDGDEDEDDAPPDLPEEPPEEPPEEFLEEFPEEFPDEYEADGGTAYCYRAHYALADGPRGDQAQAALRRLVTELVADSDVGTACELVEDGAGVLVLLSPALPATGLMRATVNGLPARLAQVGGLRLRVEFWLAESWPDGTSEQAYRADPEAVDAALEESAAQAVVAVSSAVYDDEDADDEDGTPLYAPGVFLPLDGGAGWFHTVRGAGHRSGAAVRGPYPMPSGGWVPGPRDASEAVVLLPPDGGPVAADAAIVRSTPAAERARWRYAEVDLRERRLVPGDGAGIEVTWRVDDPVRAAAHPGTDPPRVLARALADARRTGRDLATALARVTVPGYAIGRVTGSGRADRSGRSRGRTAQDALLDARCVLFGFDDVVARLYRPGAEREVLLDVMELLAEERDPGDALSGSEPLPRVGPPPASEGYAGTLDLIRAFAGHRLAPDVRLRLDRHEERAARTARPTPLADRLIRALRAQRVPVAVVTDRAEAPVRAFLRRRDLMGCLPGGVHGRDADLTRLMPDPDVLRRALDRLDAAAAECVLLGSSVAEQSAARALGMPFIGCGRDEAARRLRATDGDALLVPDLRPLLTAVESR
ncbi:SAV_2336 N-terminal domain-related protein [Streptomyces sp. HMX87]|uniref:SAV_2336 N-terminal domain-related protein n=1 Tax=Streptomyces sp. HMX87 TaxID=3390849 RepID=UPI003A8BF58B